jgi:hypothetical protein
MRRHLFLHTLFAALLTLAACDTTTVPTAPATEAYGRLVVGEMRCAVSEAVALPTRAEAEDFEGFVATLKQLKSQDTDAPVYEELRRYTGTQIARQLQGQSLVLPTGDYLLQLFNTRYETDRHDTLTTALSYYGEATFRIQQDEVTEVSELVSRPQGVAIGARFSSEVVEFFTGSLTVTDATRSLQWTVECLDDSLRQICFPQGSSLSYRIVLTNERQEEYIREASIPAEDAWYQIEVKVE